MSQSPTPVYVRIMSVHCWPGQWLDYQAASERLCLESRRLAHARLAVWVIRSTEDPDQGIALSLWTSREALEEYEASDWYRKRMMPELEPFLVGEIPVTRGELRFQYETNKGWTYRRSRFQSLTEPESVPAPL